MSGQKTRSVGPIIEKPCEHHTGHSMHPIIMKICQNVCHVGSKTRSVGQIIEKSCEHLKITVLVQSSSNLLRMIILTISRSNYMGHVGSKTRSVGPIIEKPCNTLEATLCIQSSWKFVKMFVLMKSLSSLNMGHVGSKTRSVSQIIEKPCEHLKVTVFGPIFIKLAQNDHLDNISVKFEYGSCRVKN